MAQPPERSKGVDPCPVCDGEPRVLVVMAHPSMLRLTRELLERECSCWVATEACEGPALALALDRLTPDVLVIDAADSPAACSSAMPHIPLARVIVIGPEPDPSYRAAALSNGVGGWLAREDVADQLGGEIRRVLGCRHDSCTRQTARTG